jgi:hypothetical protein
LAYREGSFYHWILRSNINSNNDDNKINLANLDSNLAGHAPGHMFAEPKWKIVVFLYERANMIKKMH